MTPSSPDAMMAAVTASMKERTGRSIEEWTEVVRASGIDPLAQNAVRRWLRDEHGIGQNTQWAIADAAARAAGWERPSLAEFIDQQYAGAKASLRPVFEAVRNILERNGRLRAEPPEAVTSPEGRAAYAELARRLDRIDRDRGTAGNRLFYLAVPPSLNTSSRALARGSSMPAPCSPRWRT